MSSPTWRMQAALYATSYAPTENHDGWMMRHLFSCLSMIANQSGTCVVIPGWNGPKSPYKFA